MARKRESESPGSELGRSARKRTEGHTPEKKADTPPAKKPRVSLGAAEPKEGKVEASASKKAKAEVKAEAKDEKALTPGKSGRPEAGKGKEKVEKTPKPRKNGKPADGKGKDEEDGDVVESAASNILSRKIVVEACTQCKSFRERAEKVKTGLERAIPGISVEINAQKPRRGYFEIREEKTEVVLSLPSMTRPFTPMKQLNMDEIVEDLIKRCS